jgi:hypothetical protein
MRDRWREWEPMVEWDWGILLRSRCGHWQSKQRNGSRINSRAGTTQVLAWGVLCGKRTQGARAEGEDRSSSGPSSRRRSSARRDRSQTSNREDGTDARTCRLARASQVETLNADIGCHPTSVPAALPTSQEHSSSREHSIFKTSVQMLRGAPKIQTPRLMTGLGTRLYRNPMRLNCSATSTVRRRHSGFICAAPVDGYRVYASSTRFVPTVVPGNLPPPHSKTILPPAQSCHSREVPTIRPGSNRPGGQAIRQLTDCNTDNEDRAFVVPRRSLAPGHRVR